MSRCSPSHLYYAAFFPSNRWACAASVTDLISRKKKTKTNRISVSCPDVAPWMSLIPTPDVCKGAMGGTGRARMRKQRPWSGQGLLHDSTWTVTEYIPCCGMAATAAYYARTLCTDQSPRLEVACHQCHLSLHGGARTTQILGSGVTEVGAEGHPPLGPASASSWLNHWAPLLKVETTAPGARIHGTVQPNISSFSLLFSYSRISKIVENVLILLHTNQIKSNLICSIVHVKINWIHMINISLNYFLYLV